MTRSDLLLFLRTVMATVLLATATIADATLYRWVDDRGHVTYSNVPPPPGARVVEIVTMEEDRAPTASELRTRQILEEAERERRSLEPGDPAALALGAYLQRQRADRARRFVVFGCRRWQRRAEKTKCSAT